MTFMQAHGKLPEWQFFYSIFWGTEFESQPESALLMHRIPLQLDQIQFALIAENLSNGKSYRKHL